MEAPFLGAVMVLILATKHFQRKTLRWKCCRLPWRGLQHLAGGLAKRLAEDPSAALADYS